jgi:hypothetical protein
MVVIVDEFGVMGASGIDPLIWVGLASGRSPSHRRSARGEAAHPSGTGQLVDCARLSRTHES